MAIAAAVLQAVVIFELASKTNVNRMDICHLAVVQHVVVVGCAR